MAPFYKTFPLLCFAFDLLFYCSLYLFKLYQFRTIYVNERVIYSLVVGYQAFREYLLRDAVKE
jgi:hypothetical protein